MNCPLNGSPCPKRTGALLLAICALALAVRLYALDGESAWIDEIGTYNASAQPTWGGFIDYLRTHERTPPLYYLLLRGWLRWGEGVEWGRLLSVFLGVAGVIALYTGAAVSLSARVALVAALCLALSPYHVFYSQQLRSYVLQCLGTTLATGGLAWWLRSPGPWSPALLFVAGSVIALGSGYLSVLVVAVHGVLVLWAALSGRLRWPAVAAAGVAIVLLSGPSYLLLPAHLALSSFTPPPPGPETLFVAVCHFAGGVFWLAPAPLIFLGAVALIVLFTQGVRWDRPETAPNVQKQPLSWMDSPVWVWAISAVVPALLLYLISFVRPIMLEGERYLILVLPMVWAVAACGILQGPRRWCAGWVAVLGLLTVITLYGQLTKPQLHRWRDAAEAIAEQRRATDCAIAVPLSSGEVLAYYLSPAARVLQPDPEHMEQDLARMLTGVRGVWVVSVTDQPTTLDQVLEQQGFTAGSPQFFPTDHNELVVTRYIR